MLGVFKKYFLKLCEIVMIRLILLIYLCLIVGGKMVLRVVVLWYIVYFFYCMNMVNDMGYESIKRNVRINGDVE